MLPHSPTHWYLQPSVTWQWMWLQAWFFHCSTSLHSEMCLFTNCSMNNASWTYLCPPLCSSFFTDNVKCRFMIAWYGFPQTLHAFLLYVLHRVYSSFLYFSLLVPLCNRRSIGKNRVQWVTSLLSHNWILGCAFRCEIIINAYLAHILSFKVE